MLTCIILAAGAAVAAAQEATNPPPSEIVVTTRGCGFIDAIRYRGREIARSGAGFVGGRIRLVGAGDGTAASLFTGQVARMLISRIADVAMSNEVMTVRGLYTDGMLAVPFARRITLDKGRDTIDVSEHADFSGLDPAWGVAGYSLDIPIVLATNEHERMFALGGERRAELFRMDMNDLRRKEQLISAPRAHWPFWDIAGVLYEGQSYRMWKANHADTPAYPIEAGTNGPGWADYSDRDAGITIAVAEPEKSAPWSVTMDARAGYISISPYPAGRLPVSGRELGTRRLEFRIILHEGSWPAPYPCELSFETYGALLEDIVGLPSDKPAWWLLSGALGTADIDTIMFLERIQPSTVLRTLYRGDAYRMQGRMKSIGRQTPRNMPMDEWEAEARIYLERIRRDGVPKPLPVQKP